MNAKPLGIVAGSSDARYRKRGRGEHMSKTVCLWALAGLAVGALLALPKYFQAYPDDWSEPIRLARVGGEIFAVVLFGAAIGLVIGLRNRGAQKAK